MLHKKYPAPGWPPQRSRKEGYGGNWEEEGKGAGYLFLCRVAQTGVSRVVRERASLPMRPEGVGAHAGWEELVRGRDG